MDDKTISLKSIALPDLKVVLPPLLMALALAVAFIFTVKFAVERISLQLGQISQVKSWETVLNNKLGLLKDLSGKVSSGVEVSAVALPEKNSTLALVATIKDVAKKEPIVIKEIKILPEAFDSSSGVTSVGLSVAVDGNLPQIIDFLEVMVNSAPISTVSNVTFEDSGAGVISASIQFRTYFAPYPKEIPDVAAAVNEFTPTENQTLTRINGFSLPTFTTAAGQAPGSRLTPFP
jgi:Tfp pilus assembly protein PilO